MYSAALAVVWLVALLSTGTLAQYKAPPRLPLQPHPMPPLNPLPPGSLTPLPPSSVPHGSTPGPVVPRAGGSGGGCPPNCADIPGPWREAMRAAGAVISLEAQRSNLQSWLKLPTFDERARLEQLLRLTTTPWVVGNVYGDAATIVAEHAKPELTTLLDQAVSAIAAKMRDDVAAVTPYFWNVLARGQRLRFEEIDRAIHETGERARIELQWSIETIRDPEGRRVLFYRPGEAVKQLQQLERARLQVN